MGKDLTWAWPEALTEEHGDECGWCEWVGGASEELSSERGRGASLPKA